MGSPAAKSCIVFANKERILKARELVVFHLREKGTHQDYRSEQSEGSHWGDMGKEGRIPPGLQG